MCGSTGIDVETEPLLLPLAKKALITPLPRGWAIYKDEKGEPFYYDAETGFFFVFYRFTKTTRASHFYYDAKASFFFFEVCFSRCAVYMPFDLY